MSWTHILRLVCVVISVAIFGADFAFYIRDMRRNRRRADVLGVPHPSCRRDYAA